jgi:hypothetical protein
MKKRIGVAKAMKKDSFDITRFVATYSVKHDLTHDETSLIVNFLIELAKAEAKAEKRREVSKP